MESVIPKEKKVEYRAAYKQQQERSKDDPKKGQNGIWGPTFTNRQHFNDLHFC